MFWDDAAYTIGLVQDGGIATPKQKPNCVCLGKRRPLRHQNNQQCPQGAKQPSGSVVQRPGLRALREAVSDPDQVATKTTDTTMCLDLIVANLKSCVESRNLRGNADFQTGTAAFWCAALLKHMETAQYSEQSLPKHVLLLRKWLVEFAVLQQTESQDTGGV